MSSATFEESGCDIECDIFQNRARYRAQFLPKSSAISSAVFLEIERDIERVFAARGGVGDAGERVIIGDEIIRLTLFLQLDGRAHHAEIIADMQRAGRLNARENSHGRGR